MSRIPRKVKNAICVARSTRRTARFRQRAWIYFRRGFVAYLREREAIQ